MGTFVSGQLQLRQTINGSTIPTAMIWGRNHDGTVICQHGLSITNDNNGEPIAMDLNAAWQTVDAKLLAAALKNAEWIQEEDLPVTVLQGRNRQTVLTTGVLAKLNPADAIAFGADLSLARYIQEDGSFTEVSGVLALTQRALNALNFGAPKVSYDTKLTKPYDVGDLMASLDYVRANGPVEYPFTFQNGDRSDRMGFPKGTQKTSQDLAISAQNAEANVSSILSRVNPGVRVRNEQPRQFSPRPAIAAVY